MAVNREKTIDSDVFGRLLRWLDQDVDRAGEKYEQIRSRLIRIFEMRGCPVAEDLADATIDRVAFKLAGIIGSYVGKPELYFYGVAQNIYLEHVRRKPIEAPAPQRASTEELEAQHECLEECLQGLTHRSRKIITQYYAEERHTKIETRTVLARRHGIGANALRIRVHRIRKILAECLADCLKRKSF